MANFPSVAKIVEDIAALKPHFRHGEPNPRRGEIAAVEYISDLAKKFGLGTVSLIPLPKTPAFKPYLKSDPGLMNVMIEAGKGNDELLVLEGHTDIVPPTDYRGESYAIAQGLDPDTITKLGSYDMLGGVAGILHALRKMKIANHRRVRALFVIGEENESEGMFAALDRTNNALEFPGKRVALTTEITVEARMTDDLHIVVGRPGRFSYNFEIDGTMQHRGSVRKRHLEEHVWARRYEAYKAMHSIEFPAHPNDSLGLLDNGQWVLAHDATETPESLSTPGYSRSKFDVYYANPNLTSAAIQEMLTEAVRKALGCALGEERFVISPQDRAMPMMNPWLERLGPGTYAAKIQGIASGVTAEGWNQPRAEFRGGGPVADDNILGQIMPTVTIPPRGEGEHTNREKGSLRSITDYQVPIMVRAAGFDGMLNPEQDVAA